MNTINISNAQVAETKSISTEIVINAHIDSVWKVLTNLEEQDWNPFLRITGELKEGNKIDVLFLKEDGSDGQTFHPVVLKHDTNKTLKWRGKLFVTGLFDGEHLFRLEKIDENTTRLIHSENFSGLLSGMILKSIGEETKANFIKLNEALKAKCETKN